MSLKNISRYIINKNRILSVPPKYSNDSSGDKGKDGESDDKQSLADLQFPSGSSCDNDNNPSAPTMYDCRKYGHNLPCDTVAPQFETLPQIPTGVFRSTCGEVLGRGANKGGYYQNPEYFSYHHMTFYDMHLILRLRRQPSLKTGRKP